MTPEDRNVESLFIIDQIQSHIDEGMDPNDIAIIYRKNSNPIELIEMFRRVGISYRKQRGENLLHNPETRKLLRTLQVIDNLEDDALLWEVLLYDFWKLDIAYLLKVQNLSLIHI